VDGNGNGVGDLSVVGWVESSNYSAYAPEVPGCVATGSTAKQAEANMRTALEMHLRGMKEDGLALDTSEVVVRRVRVG
jgi:predicted RNase H-like HicB family nuclease